ncbi:MAG TPA: DHHA1 domain-containing protein, partial [Pyrinomonadaceae bacterium]|nr:DHHA1 domain-containing protein [Pyrinomonadaceae bacterium]
VDWPRRLDHMQQHTGQHILSQAFFRLFNAETRSFRMMEQYSEIDVELTNPGDGRINEAVELANKIIWDDRAVHVREVTSEEAALLPLRKDSERAGELRIIEIEDFDLSPCGGTHARRTGEVGVIAVRSWERAKGLTRMEFLAGGRVVADYRRANRTARNVASLFSVARDEATASVERLMEENKQLSRRVRVLEEVAARVEAEELFRDAIPQEDGTKIIAHVFDDRDAGQLQRLAHQIASHPKAVALLGSHDKDAARLVFARSADAAGDMNLLMREACALLGGRGGGRPDMAQGGGQNTERLSDALQAASSTLVNGERQN